MTVPDEEESANPADRAIMERFAENLRVARARRNVSQEVVARAAGIHRTHISLLEGGQRSPRLSTLIRLAAGLGVDPSVLLEGITFDPESEQD